MKQNICLLIFVFLITCTAGFVSCKKNDSEFPLSIHVQAPFTKGDVSVLKLSSVSAVNISGNSPIPLSNTGEFSFNIEEAKYADAYKVYVNRAKKEPIGQCTITWQYSGKTVIHTYDFDSSTTQKEDFISLK